MKNMQWNLAMILGDKKQYDDAPDNNKDVR